MGKKLYFLHHYYCYNTCTCTLYLYCTRSLLFNFYFSLQLTHHNKLLHQLNLTEDQQIIVKTTTIGGYSAAVRGAHVKFNMYLSLSLSSSDN